MLNGVGFEDYLSRNGQGGCASPVRRSRVSDAIPHVLDSHMSLDFINQQLLSAPAACNGIVPAPKNRLRARVLPLAACSGFSTFFLLSSPIQTLALSGLGRSFFTRPAVHAVDGRGIPQTHTRPRTTLPQRMSVLWGGRTPYRPLDWSQCERRTGGSTVLPVSWEDSPGYANANGWVTLAKFQRRQQNVPAALEAYKRALKADPTNTKRWIIVGNYLQGNW